ncbi:MAG: hypothetical protein DDT19_00079 [Syntrophomonadaceae bacterium]|nr:hypothetical protein [Bacillota bacterium]
MSCVECEKFQETDWVYWIRWKAATVGVLACEKHFMEIRQAFIAAMRAERETEEKQGVSKEQIS